MLSLIEAKRDVVNGVASALEGVLLCQLIEEPACSCSLGWSWVVRGSRFFWDDGLGLGEPAGLGSDGILSEVLWGFGGALVLRSCGGLSVLRLRQLDVLTELRIGDEVGGWTFGLGELDLWGGLGLELWLGLRAGGGPGGGLSLDGGGLIVVVVLGLRLNDGLSSGEELRLETRLAYYEYYEQNNSDCNNTFTFLSLYEYIFLIL